MTEPDPTTDELVSAYLDGEATPEEVARVEADPVLVARTGQLAAVASAVGAPVALDTFNRRRMLDAALDAWGGDGSGDSSEGDAEDNSENQTDAPGGGDGSTSTGASVSQIPRRSRRHQLLGVAAAVAGLVALAGAGAVLLDGTDTSQEYQQTALEISDDAGNGDESYLTEAAEAGAGGGAADLGAGLEQFDAPAVEDGVEATDAGDGSPQGPASTLSTPPDRTRRSTAGMTSWKSSSWARSVPGPSWPSPCRREWTPRSVTPPRGRPVGPTHWRAPTGSVSRRSGLTTGRWPPSCGRLASTWRDLRAWCSSSN